MYKYKNILITPIDCLRPRPILAVLGIVFIQLFRNWTTCTPITYTNKKNVYRRVSDSEVVLYVYDFK